MKQDPFHHMCITKLSTFFKTDVLRSLNLQAHCNVRTFKTYILYTCTFITFLIGRSYIATTKLNETRSITKFEHFFQDSDVLRSYKRITMYVSSILYTCTFITFLIVDEVSICIVPAVVRPSEHLYMSIAGNLITNTGAILQLILLQNNQFQRIRYPVCKD